MFKNCSKKKVNINEKNIKIEVDQLGFGEINKAFQEFTFNETFEDTSFEFEPTIKEEVSNYLNNLGFNNKLFHVTNDSLKECIHLLFSKDIFKHSTKRGIYNFSLDTFFIVDTYYPTGHKLGIDFCYNHRQNRLEMSIGLYFLTDKGAYFYEHYLKEGRNNLNEFFEQCLCIISYVENQLIYKTHLTK